MAISAKEWAEEHFGSVGLGDPRRPRRLAACAALIAQQPGKSFPQVFDWNQLRAFYNLCDRREASLPAIQATHWEITRQAMAREPLVLIVHDTTELDFSFHNALEGKGPIGNHKGSGFLQHNSLAFSPDGSRLLGLAFQQFKARRPTPEKETTRARKSRDRESLMWQEGIRAPGRPPQGSAWVDVGDRGSDIYEAMEEALAQGHDFLFRLCQNRLVFPTAEQDKQVRLKDYVRGLPGAGGDTVEVPGRGGRPARTARVKLASAPVWVPAPKGTPKARSRPVLAAWVTRVWEPAPPAGVEQPLEWILLSSVVTESVGQMKQRRDWYSVRWQAEVYHDVEKNGASMEGRMFQTKGRMEACLAVLAVVAVRVFQLRLAVKATPDADAREVASEGEVEVVKEHLGGRKALTVREFVFAVGKLGGFLGRKRDGTPGVRAVWRGYQRLQDMVAGFRLRQRPRRLNSS